MGKNIISEKLKKYLPKLLAFGWKGEFCLKKQLLNIFTWWKFFQIFLQRQAIKKLVNFKINGRDFHIYIYGSRHAFFVQIGFRPLFRTQKLFFFVLSTPWLELKKYFFSTLSTPSKFQFIQTIYFTESHNSATLWWLVVARAFHDFADFCAAGGIFFRLHVIFAKSELEN